MNIDITPQLAGRWIASAALLLTVAAAQAATPSVNVTIGGEVVPGVYGRVEIGTAPPPVVLYPQPVVIVHQPRPAVVAPVYLHVPPGHAKKWHKHCHKYNACAQPVYFVRSVEYSPEYQRKHRKQRHKDRHDD